MLSIAGVTSPAEPTDDPLTCALVDPRDAALDAGGFVARWSSPLPASPAWLVQWLAPSASLASDVLPFAPADAGVREAVRKLLRFGGYKPSGRGKPAAEYLVGAAEAGTLSSINLAVDLCNVVSLHSGLPISVIDLDRARTPMHVALAPAGASYVFNASGQEIALAGLPCLYDADGPCANAVKDSQRTKTHAGTQAVFCIVWGTKVLGTRTAETIAWYRQLSERCGATCTPWH
ncbi:MAG: hypothetical protein IPH07_35935 [Deltaproteobacteria bacterium]|nr:hypothetical protein [Deltaproteobacteria bacterium]MBK8235578.1 hypothetical protein [Deltaproteobacteria bacterium]MBK8713209.1 hypothetical protein [Deltaproteobacteria bacterium]MBP7286787.1 hypothetical protein [Nannocystaceae bacterium]